MRNFIDAKKVNAYLIAKNDIVVEMNKVLRKWIGFEDLTGMHVEEVWNLIKLEEKGGHFRISVKNKTIENVTIEVFQFKDEQLKTYVFRQEHGISPRNLNRKHNHNRFFECYKNKIEKETKHLKKIVSVVEDCISIIDKHGRFIKANRFIRGLIDSKNQGEARGIFDKIKCYYLNGDEITYKESTLSKVMEGQEIYNSKEMIKIGNVTKYFIINAKPILDVNGRFDGAIIVFLDITDTVIELKKIEAQNSQLQAIIDNMSDDLYIIDKDRNYIGMNNSGRRRLKPAIFQLSHPIQEHFKYFDENGNELDYESTPIAKLSRGEEIKNCTVVAYDPTKRYLNCNGKPIFDDNKNLIMGILNVKDVTRDILHKQAIERQIDMINQIIYNLDLPVVRLSYPDLMVLDVNQEGFNKIKFAKPEIKSIHLIKGQIITEVFHSFCKSDIYQFICEAAAEKRTKHQKNKKIRFVDTEQYLNIIYEPIFGFDGQIQEIALIMVDVTSEVKSNLSMEKLLKQQEEFIANISHELKTPLNIIYSAVQLFSMFCNNGSLDEKRDTIVRYINTMIQSCYRLSKLVNNIVDFSKIEAGFYELTMSRQNIVSVIEDTVMSVVEYSADKGINITFDTDVEEKYIVCDSEKIERVMLNLLSNAIKFSDVGGTIFVEVQDKKEFVEISVIDHGTGIDKKYLDSIFERFKQVDKSFSRNAEGTGIRLSLVKAILDLHGGKIFAESELGKGSRFRVQIPVLDEEKEKVEMQNNMINEGVNKHMVNIELSDIY